MSHSSPGQTQFRSLLSTITKNRKKLVAALGFLMLAVVVFRVSVISVRSHSAPASPVAGPTMAAEKAASVELAGDVAIFNKLFPTLAIREAENQGMFTLLHHRWASPVVAPTITASKTDALFTDVDNDNNADPGDTLEYTVTINNPSAEDATGVTFTDTVDPNTAFVGGSLTATPVAVNDSYQALGNVRISVPAPGVLGNDYAGVPTATITGAPVTSVNGGDVTLNANGSFTYNPPAGFEGSDSFTYTLTNSAGSNNATVTITVSGMIWFINNAASCPCDGRLTNPFNTLAAFNAVNDGVGNHPAINDNIFVYESATDYVGPVTLLNGQRFIGQDATASLSAITGLTPPTFSDPLPATNSGNGVIVNITSLTSGINVASGNTLRGFTGGNAAPDINGSSFGTLTISDVTLNGTGQALNLTTGTLAATFGSISSSASTTTGISLTSVGGTLTSPTTTITGSVGIGISVNTSSGTLNFGNTSATLSGGTGVFLNTNTGPITFGSLTITPDAGQRGLHAIDNSGTITSTSGSVTTSNATAVEITRASGTTPLVIGLTSVAATGGNNGIFLSNTSGSFTVAGSGGTCTFASPAGCSGGRITTTTGADNSTNGIGVYLNNATNISLTRMRIDNHPNFGIRGHGVNGFTLQTSVVDGNNGTSATADTDIVNGEDSVRIINLIGSALIDDCFIGGGYENNIRIVNDTGTLNRLTISDSSIGDLDGAGAGRGVDNTNGDDNVNLEARNSGTVLNATLTNNILNNARGDVIQTNANLGTSMDVVFRLNRVSNNHPNIVSAGGGATFSGTGATTYDISCNNFRDSEGIGLNVFKVRPANGQTGGTWSGTIFNNTVGVTGVVGSGSGAGASGINVEAQGNGTHTTLVKNNVVRQYGEAGIKMSVVDANTVAPVAVTLNATVIGNLTAEPDPNNAFAGFFGTQGAVPGADANTTFNLKLGGAGAEQNNFTAGDPFDANDVFIFNGSGDGNFNLTQGNSTSTVATQVVIDNNTSPITVFADDPNITVVVANPALPAAVDQTCSPAAPASLGSSEEGSGNITVSEKISSSWAAQTSSSLRAAPGENSGGQSVATLNQGELAQTAREAIARWASAGLSSADIGRMEALTLQIVDLPNGELASIEGTTLKLDATAAGYGWYSDVSPTDDSEYAVPVPNKELQTTEMSFAHGRMDLLTVLMRQLRLALGTDGLSSQGQRGWLMQNTLGTGTRRAPAFSSGPVSKAQPAKDKQSKVPATAAAKPKQSSTARQQIARLENQRSARTRSLKHHATVTPRATSYASLADVMENIGILPAGESVTIKFRVTVDDPFTGSGAQVCNQGTVSGTNFSTVLTDDPDVGGAADATCTPIDLPSVSVAVAPASVAEDGATNLVYTFTRNGSTASALTVNFSIGGTATFGASPNDYTQTGAATFSPPNGTVTIGAGNTTAMVTIDPEADTTVEPDETVVLTVVSGTGYVVGAPSSAIGTITNDDTDVSVAVSPLSVAEDGATNLVYTFTRTGVTTGSLTVNFSIGGTATFGASPNDYTQTGATTFTPPTGTVTFTAGNSTAQITVDPEADTTVEPDETVILTVTAGTGYNVGTPSSATGTITNDDADVSIAVSPAAVTEDGATNLVYTFTRTGFTGGSLVVNFTIGGTATFGASPNDYTQTGATTFTPPTGTVTFGPGNSTAQITVDPETDATAEPDETVTLTLAAGTGYNVVSPSSATGTILNDDTVVTVVVSPASTPEGGANLVYTFTRTGSTGSSLTVNFSVGGTASFPADYSQSGAATFSPPNATVTIGAGNSSANVNVTPLTDCATEGNETVEFTVQPGTGYGVGSPSTATGTIVDVPDTTAPVITLDPSRPTSMWPPDHSYHSFTVSDFVLSASDNCDPNVDASDVYITKITSDEAENGVGDGDTVNDITISGDCKSFQLRAERSVVGDGRVYTIHFKVVDSNGNVGTATATVIVPISFGGSAVDSGPVYTVMSVCP